MNGQDISNLAESGSRPAELQGWLRWINQRAALGLTSKMQSQLLLLALLLREWNQKMNLTAILDDEGIAVRHYLDSLTLLPYLDACAAEKPGQPLRLIDVGTGAGFPGLIIKIARPEWNICLLDSLAKRVQYLETVISQLELPGISAQHGRAEDAARDPQLREQFDCAAARAVAALPVLCEYCLPFVIPGGCFLAMKGDFAPEWPAAANAVRILGGKLKRLDSFQLPGTDIQRSIFEISKIHSTPPGYPRKAGKPEQKPLV